MKRIMTFLLTVLMILAMSINTYAYTYTGGVPKPTAAPAPPEEDKVFTNDNRAFSINSPSINGKYIVGEPIRLSMTPEMFFFTVLPGGFTASNPNDLVMKISLDGEEVKTFKVSYSKDETGKTYSDSFTPTKVGTYTVNIKLRNSNYGNYNIYVTKGVTEKKANTMTVKATNQTVKYSKIKSKSVKISPIKVKKAKGTVTYTKVSGNKYFTVNGKTGTIKIKKGLKKGTYKIKVNVRAAGTKTYEAASKNVTVKVKVK